MDSFQRASTRSLDDDSGRRKHSVNGAEKLGHWGGVILATSTTHGIRVEDAISTRPLPVGLLDGPAADLQALGQFPLAQSLRPLHPDVLPLPVGQAGPPAASIYISLIPRPSRSSHPWCGSHRSSVLSNAWTGRPKGVVKVPFLRTVVVILAEVTSPGLLSCQASSLRGRC